MARAHVFYVPFNWFDKVMTRRNFLALSALTILVAGCGGGGGGTDTKAAVVKGIVYDSLQADLPIEGATVTIGEASAVTTARANASADNQVGSFRINGATVGATTATVTVPGKPAQTIAFQPSISSGTNSDLALYLNIGQVRGRVLDEAGKPVSSAFVVVNTGQGSINGFSNPDGTFLLDLVPDGPAELSAGAGSKIALKNLTVAFGINETGNLKLQTDPNPNPPSVLKTISGKVRANGSLTALAAAPVSLLRSGAVLESTVTDAAGSYYFVVPAGNYSIQVAPSGYVAQTQVARLANPNTPIKVDFSLTAR